MAERIFMKLGMYIVALVLNLTTYFINPSLRSVCVYVSIVARQRLSKNPLIVARQRLVKTLPRQRIRAIFYTVHVVSNKSAVPCLTEKCLIAS
jgi:hypothetical protein